MRKKEGRVEGAMEKGGRRAGNLGVVVEDKHCFGRMIAARRRRREV